MDVAEAAKEGVQAAVPRASGRLKRSIKLKLFPYRQMGFVLRAGAKTPKGINYGWFTELGTDDAANHAVDAVGYIHTSKGPPPDNWTGIPAMHWFSGPLGTATKGVAKRLTTAILDAYHSIFRR